jgi:membrane associated rhomboid family serine protease
MSQLEQWLNPRSSAAKMAVVFVVASLAFYLTKSLTAEWIPLVPYGVTHQLKIWQLVTYSVLFDASPMSFIFGVLVLVSVGGALEAQWGAKRLWLFSFGIALLSGALTVALSLVLPPVAVQLYTGANVIVSAQWVGYGLLVGRGRTNFFGLPVTGNTLALIGASFVLLNLVLQSAHWAAMVPDVLGLLLTFVHVRYGFPQEAWTRLQSWRLQRDLQKRSSHLRVISGEDRNTSRGSDKYLH